MKRFFALAVAILATFGLAAFAQAQIATMSPSDIGATVIPQTVISPISQDAWQSFQKFIRIASAETGQPIPRLYAQATAPAASTSTTTAAATPAVADEGFNLGLLAMGQDNLWLAPLGGQHGGAFFSVGAGMDFAAYKKTLNAAGSVLAVTVHGGGAVVATGKYGGDAIGYASLNVDLIQLITGSPITLLTKATKLTIGPTIAYDTAQKCAAVGGLLNFSYSF
jgi:hypothetical protein